MHPGFRHKGPSDSLGGSIGYLRLRWTVAKPADDRQAPIRGDRISGPPPLGHGHYRDAGQQHSEWCQGDRKCVECDAGVPDSYIGGDVEDRSGRAVGRTDASEDSLAGAGRCHSLERKPPKDQRQGSDERENHGTSSHKLLR